MPPSMPTPRPIPMSQSSRIFPLSVLALARALALVLARACALAIARA